MDHKGDFRVKRKKRKKPILACVIGCIFCAFFAFYFWGSSSFSLQKIHPSKGFFFQSAKGASEKELEELQGVFAQSFSFLNEGGEFYVFVSQDQKYVIKFFKVRRLTPKYWLNYIPIPWLDKKRISKVDERERIRLETFQGLKLAFEKFRYQSGLVFLHLFRTDYLKIKIKVIDAQGKSHKISLDSVPFVLQKRVTMLPDYISMLIKEDREDDAVRALCQILDLVKESCLCGFVDDSETVECDYGFIEERAVRVGGGRLLREEPGSSFRSVLREVFRASKAIEAWLVRNHPSLVPKFQDEVQDLLSFLEQE
jgi:hypothetical protein